MTFTTEAYNLKELDDDGFQSTVSSRLINSSLISSSNEAESCE